MSSHKLLENPQALCNIVRRIAITAGEITLEYFDDVMGYQGADMKADGSPLTIADEKAEEHIIKELKAILPDVPLVGEESTAQGRVPDIEGEDFFWLVDPLDGTKEFISGSGDYTVNIALIYKGDPVLGVIYSPVHGELYAGCGPGTAIRWNEESNTEKSISVRRTPAKGLTIVSSRSHGSSAEMEAFLQDYKVNKVIRRGSSLKICNVAAGKADMYPRLGPTCEWDTAAGDAILRSAGGVIVDLDDKPFRYGHTERKFLNPSFVARASDF